ncbi:D-isomer specific 2-hydroxyacid dehydrogenase, NAD-binding [Alkaliphilus metalliredigens QYMF]|uniref:D-isomer specific 2-hydroxyacid dehydrogenase, NAD-binding n=1 Tax=Alkaliphilus metalliredigens (strain QYMF) TaxID=293826 RepID=A6TU58_ALKMQ|nr:D-2-hydroxyacid dehydrogenase [Alkaliphilus metalliredigens]ABR49726.1 D-isomer specific 2-hydroxyacid dehydrogenase, NAD-binding [Alkaliphilus metalliredigens QYMF]
MPRILVNDKIDQKSLDAISAMGIELTVENYPADELKKQIKEYDGIIVRSATKVTQEIIDEALETGKLRLIIRAGVGLDNIDGAYAMKNGITVRNTPDASKVSVAELTIAHMLMIARKLQQSNVTMRQGKWLKKEYRGVEIEGKTLGLIGFGRIAKIIAQRAAALGMKVVYNTRSGKVQGFDEFKYLSKEDLIQSADFISLHVPHSQEAGAVIAKKEFDMMKDGVYVLNCARGGVICEASLLEALDSGKVAAAALDVFEEEPVKNEAIYLHEKISLSPHIGASTAEAQEGVGKEIVQIIKEFFKI